MIIIKTEKEFEKIKDAGTRLGELFDYLIPYIKPGISTYEIDKLAEKGVYFESYFSDVVFSNHCFPLNWKGKYAVTANAMTENFVKRFLEGKLPVHSKKVEKRKDVEDVDARQA